MIGVLNVNKPAGWSSRDAVNRVQRLAREAAGAKQKVGHAGTLDPLASGVLVVCVGGATRLIEYVQRMEKRYTATFLLGRRSPSDDTELEVEQIANAPVPSPPQIEAAAAALVGEIQQVPPAYSAVKIDGQRAYKQARRGDAVALAARTVTVRQISVLRYEHPELVLDVRCGSGTYIRALGRDLAASLGTGAVMSALVRTAVGDFSAGDALDPRALDAHTLSEHLLPAGAAVAALPRLELTEPEVAELRHGRAIAARGPSAGESAGFGPDGRLAAILAPRRGRLWPTRVLSGP